MNEKLLIYGVLNGKSAHIDEVENGLKCGCVCSYCNMTLIAKNNDVNILTHHFAHSTVDCEYAYESAIHLLAKEIILERKKIFIPEYRYQISNSYNDYIFKAGLIEFDEVKNESRITTDEIIIQPDTVGTINKRKIYIEFVYKHDIDDVKLEKISRLEFDCIRVDLNTTRLDRESIILLLETDNNSKKWVNNNFAVQEYERIINIQKNIICKEIEKFLKINNEIRIPEFYSSHDFEDSFRNISFYVDVKFDEVISCFDNEYEISIFKMGINIKPSYILKMNDRCLCIDVLFDNNILNNLWLKKSKYNFPYLIIFVDLNNLQSVEELLIVDTKNKYWIANPYKQSNEKAQIKLFKSKVKNNYSLLSNYKINPDYRVFEFNSSQAKLNLCPKKKLIISELKNTKYYYHSVLKRIIDGEEWDLIIYSMGLAGKYIKLNKLREYVNKDELLEEGLGVIKAICNENLGKCNKCNFLETALIGMKNAAYVCKYRNN